MKDSPQARWNLRNKQRMAGYYKKYREDNRNRLRQESRHKSAERHLRRLELHPEFHKNRLDYYRKWRTENKEKVLSYARNRRAKKKNALGSHTDTDIYLLFDAQKGLCASCLRDLKVYHVDHIHPLATGGTNSSENLQLLCPSCNLSKGAKTMEDFLEYRKLKEQQSGR